MRWRQGVERPAVIWVAWVTTHKHTHTLTFYFAYFCVGGSKTARVTAVWDCHCQGRSQKQRICIHFKTYEYFITTYCFLLLILNRYSYNIQQNARKSRHITLNLASGKKRLNCDTQKSHIVRIFNLFDQARVLIPKLTSYYISREQYSTTQENHGRSWMITIYTLKSLFDSSFFIIQNSKITQEFDQTSFIQSLQVLRSQVWIQ